MFVVGGLTYAEARVVYEFNALQRQTGGACRCVVGGDFMLRIVARNTAHENELTTRLTGVPHVTTVQTFQVIRSSKYASGVPVDDLEG